MGGTSSKYRQMNTNTRRSTRVKWIAIVLAGAMALALAVKSARYCYVVANSYPGILLVNDGFNKLKLSSVYRDDARVIGSYICALHNSDFEEWQKATQIFPVSEINSRTANSGDRTRKSFIRTQQEYQNVSRGRTPIGIRIRQSKSETILDQPCLVVDVLFGRFQVPAEFEIPMVKTIDSGFTKVFVSP